MTYLVEPAELDEHTSTLAQRLAAGPPAALSQSAAMLEHHTSLSLREALDNEARAQAVNFATDATDAVRAFVEKREPIFTGEWPYQGQLGWSERRIAGRMMVMDLHFVTYFVAVVDHGGITKAAQALYISQPSLSQAIRTLERRLGATLFDRTGRRLVLTDAGRTFDLAARRILADVERAKAKVTAVRELEFGRVDVVSYSAFSIDPMVELVRRFRANFRRSSCVFSTRTARPGSTMRCGEGRPRSASPI